jgi:hypothetical protein
MSPANGADLSPLRPGFELVEMVSDRILQVFD